MRLSSGLLLLAFAPLIAHAEPPPGSCDSRSTFSAWTECGPEEIPSVPQDWMQATNRRIAI